MNDKINKVNDMFLATIKNPNAKLYDFISNDIVSTNTQLLDKEDYKSKDVIKARFTTEEGKFDEVAFNNYYQHALINFNQLSNEDTIKKLDEVKYDAFDTSRPLDSKVFSVDVKFSADSGNQFMNYYSRDGINSVTESQWSLKEIAQKGQVKDTRTGKWRESVNEWSLLDKLFGDTLIYAQWEEEGVHVDPITGNTVKHGVGDWKLDSRGRLHLETLGDREIYGKQIVNLSDILTTDGSAINKALDFMDSDGKEKAVSKTVIKAMLEIAPFFIPQAVAIGGVSAATLYGGMRAATNLAVVMPTFFKSLEGILRGDDINLRNDPITKAENFMARFGSGTSDAGSESFWNFEQMTGMVTGIFSQIHEQRAMAGLSNILMKPDKLLNQKVMGLQAQAAILAKDHKIDINRAMKSVINRSEGLKNMYAKQSQMSKAFSLGYMALTSTGDIYGEAIEGGFDRRTAGFASMLAAAGQYGIMMNNPMGDWFLDKSTGYNVDISKSVMRKSMRPHMTEMNKILSASHLSTEVKREKLAGLVHSFKKTLRDNFSSFASNTDGILRNMITEGFEEVSEELVLDATKGIIEVANYLGLTKKQGSFNLIESYQNGEAFQNYLTNFVGGLLGGALFELERTKISPWINSTKLSEDTTRSMAELVASGYAEDMIKAAKAEAQFITNNELSFVQEDGNFKPKDKVSQADVLAAQTIEHIKYLQSILNAEGLNLTDQEILKQAVRTEIIINKLDDSKVGDDKLGIEGLIVEDFRNASARIVDIKKNIANLEEVAGNEQQIAIEKKKLSEYKKITDDILSGETGSKYFERMAVYLDPDIGKIFGSLDKGDYISAKHGKKYDSLPETGLGLTKEKADLEWKEFLDSTDIKKKLEVITNGYKALEKTLNDPIGRYVNDGYIVERKKVAENILDLEQTIKNFNTAGTAEEKQRALNNFASINKNLESLGIMKILPYDAFITDLASNLFEANLVKKKVVAEDGTVQHVAFSEAELNEEVDGVTVKQRIKDDFNRLSKLFPFNPVNLENIISDVNLYINQTNERILNNIKTISDADTNNERTEEIESLQNSIIEYGIDNYQDTDVYINLQRTLNENLDKLYEKIVDARTTEDAEKAEQMLIEEGKEAVKKYDELKRVEALYQDSEKNKYIDLSYFVGKIEEGETDFNALSDSKKADVLSLLESRGLLDRVIMENPGVRGLEDNLEALKKFWKEGVEPKKTEQEVAKTEVKRKMVTEDEFELKNEEVDDASKHLEGDSQEIKDLVDEYNEVTKERGEKKKEEKTIVERGVQEEIAEIHEAIHSLENKLDSLEREILASRSDFSDTLPIRVAAKKAMNSAREAKNKLILGSKDAPGVFGEWKQEMLISKDDFYKLSDSVANITQMLANTGTTNKSIVSWINIAHEVLNKLETIAEPETLFEGEEAQKEPTDEELNLAQFESTLMDLINGHLNTAISILTNESIESVSDESKELVKQFDKDVEDNRPEMFKIKNIAFDLLMDAFEQGYRDNELFVMAKNMFKEESESVMKRVIPGISFVTSELVEQVINGTVDFKKVLDWVTTNTNPFDEDAPFSDAIGTAAKTIKDMVEFDAKYPGQITNREVYKFITDHFDMDTKIKDVATSLRRAQSNLTTFSETINGFKKFINLKETGFKKNPLYELIRNFSMQMNSSPNAAVNKIFDILEVEELSFKAASSVEAFTSDNVRTSDLRQAINLLEMMDLVINKMSTSSFYGEDLVGFVAMRQAYAKANGTDADVLNLNTISSDQAAIMSRDIKSLQTKLRFLADLSAENKKAKAREQTDIQNLTNVIRIKHWEDFGETESLMAFTPPNLKELLATVAKDGSNSEVVNMKIETAFYDHNKNRKKEALTAILHSMENVISTDLTSYTLRTTENSVTPFTMAVYYATNLANRAEDHMKRQLLTLKSDFNKAPFYTQELNARILKASTEHTDLFKTIFEIKQNDLYADASYLSILLGGAGTGKTTVVIAQILDIIRQTNSKSTVWMAGPSSDQGTKLTRDVINAIGEESIHTTTFSKNKLFAMFGEGIKDVHSTILANLRNLGNTTSEDLVYVEQGHLMFNKDEGWEALINFESLPNLVVIDEITHFSQAEIELLNFISKKSYDHDSANFMKVVGVGDQTQMGYKAELNGEYVEYNINNTNAIFAPPLAVSVRASNEDKRSNMDLTQGLINKANDLFDAAMEKHRDSPGLATQAANEALQTFLTDVHGNLGLRHFLSEDSFNGDIIVKDYGHKAFASIRAAMEADSELTLGLLTADGAMTEEMKTSLIEAGFNEELLNDETRVKLFSRSNVQGSEADFFIFDAATIEKFDKLKDVLRAFYTYASRSREGTVIVDKNNDLFVKLNIENSKPSIYPVRYNPLTPEMITELKNARIAELETVLGITHTISEEDNFKWRKGTGEGVVNLHGEVYESDEEDDKTFTDMPAIEVVSDGVTVVDSDGAPERSLKYPEVSSDAKGVKQYSEEDFGIMFHSFYNNPNAIVSMDENGKPVKIEVNPENVATDLNGPENVEGYEESSKIIRQWARLRSILLKQNVATISPTAAEYSDFIRHIFGNENKIINVKLVRTASIFDKDVNTPYKKFGFKESELIQEGEPFLNIMAELTVGTGEFKKTHYITLATMAKLSTIKEKALPNLMINQSRKDYPGKSDEQIKTAIVNKLEASLKELNSALVTRQAEGKAPFIILQEIGRQYGPKNRKTLSIISSTRFHENNKGKKGVDRIAVHHKLTDLYDDFPGMYHSRIRIFPNKFPQFKELINRYSFGQKRSDAQIKKMFEGEVDEGGNFVSSPLAGKPYMVVSYDQHLDGDAKEDTSAKLVVVNASGRNLETLMAEVGAIKVDVNNSIKRHFGEEGKTYEELKKSFVMTDINAKTEALLDRSQILDILIEWARTDYINPDGEVEGTLIDLFTKEVDVRVIDMDAFSKKMTFLQIMDNFKRTSDGTLSPSSQRLLEVIEAVKSNINKDDVKQQVIAKTSKWVGWSWSFHNFFAFSEALRKQRISDTSLILEGFFIDETIEPGEEGYQQLASYGDALMNHLAKDPNRLFYYSLPISTAKDNTIKVNDLLSGKEGFKEEFFGDKFYISQTPESERGVLPFGMYLNLDPKAARESVEGTKRRGAKTDLKSGTGEGTTEVKETKQKEVVKKKAIETKSIVEKIFNDSGLTKIVDLYDLASKERQRVIEQAINDYDLVAESEYEFPHYKEIFNDMVQGVSEILANAGTPLALTHDYTDGLGNLLPVHFAELFDIDPENPRIAEIFDQLVNEYNNCKQ